MDGGWDGARSGGPSLWRRLGREISNVADGFVRAVVRRLGADGDTEHGAACGSGARLETRIVDVPELARTVRRSVDGDVRSKERPLP